MASFALLTLYVMCGGFGHLALTQTFIDAPPPRYFHSLDATQCRSPRTVGVRIEPEGASLSLELMESSTEFLPTDFQLDPGVKSTSSRPCFYQGVVLRAEDGLAAAKIVNGLFSATFSYAGKVYQVSNQPAWQPQMSASVLPPEPPRKCGLSTKRPAMGAAEGGSAEAKPRSKRSELKIDTGSEVFPANRKHLQMILVGDLGFYIGMNYSMTRATNRLLDIANFVNGLYKQLGVNVITVRTIVMTTDSLGLQNASSGVNASELLDKLLVYRMRTLNHTTHSVVQLVSGYPMLGGLLGLATLGKLCQLPLSAGVNWDNNINGSAYSVSTTVAHELGHNLGMSHDEEAPRGTTCPCPDRQGCIMAASGGEIDALRFTNCSVKYYQDFSVPNGLGYCMTRPSDFGISVRTAATCGNRIVEPGEDCDCGLPSYCNNTCCNPTTCKFTAGATCASGLCCNTTTCSLTAKGTPCRAARAACDLPEFCNGTSEWCPEFDDYMIDGTVCATNPANTSEVLAYCYSGDCSSRDARCAALYSGARKSAPASIAATSTWGNETGYCDYRVAAAMPLSYGYERCSAEHQRCGTLYCSADSADRTPTSNWKSLDDDEIKFLAGSIAHAMIDMTPTGFRDPGMVPNGAECGTNMMCIRSACVPLSIVVGSPHTLPNCNGRGRWAASRLCYCDPGFAPPDCVRVGNGGSVTNQPMMESAANATESTPTTSRASDTTRTPVLAISSSPSPQSDNTRWIGIGIGVGVAAACLIALVAVTVWACRHNSPSANISGGSGGMGGKGVSTVAGSGGPQINIAYQYPSNQYSKDEYYYSLPPPRVDGGFDNPMVLEAGMQQEIVLQATKF